MTDRWSINDQDIRDDNLIDRPYMRASLTAPHELPANTWTRLNLSLDLHPFDTNTYPETVAGGARKVDWDDIDKKITFNGDHIQFYTVTLSIALESLQRPGTVLLRFNIPTAPDPILFPLPGSVQHVELAELNRRQVVPAHHIEVVRSTDVLRTYGLGIELATEEVLPLNQSITVADAVLQIYPH